MKKRMVLLLSILAILFFTVPMAFGNPQARPPSRLSPGISNSKPLNQPLIDELPLEIIGVTVVPHFISGEIPSYGDDLAYNVLGANIRIFIKNLDPTASIVPEIRFNGKSGQELINSGIVSYCDAPEIRVINKISFEIPADAVDCYVLNVTDSTFYSDGIILTITDTKTGRTTQKQIQIKDPDFYATRIAFSSSTGSVLPDGFYMYFNNDSEEDVSLNEVKIWSASSYYSNHYWKDTVTPQLVTWFGSDGSVPAHDLNGAYVNTGKLPFGEILVEFDITRGTANEKLFYIVKPMVISYDIAMGWGANYLAKSEAFCKTMKFMHLNTVNGGADAFFAKKEWAAKYPIKTFSKLLALSRTTDTVKIKQIHGEEHFGEPQFDKKPAQEMYNYYTFFRHSAFPSTLTLSHEPGFNAYAGVVDFNHFDAYRVVAPHADRWGYYDKYGDKNVRWGAPLETIGDYMRTLNRISYPNRVAAWTQAMSNDWDSYSRVAYPNNLEMRIQAYEAIANGATSLYWFTLSGKHLKNHRFNLAEIQQINREIMVVGDMLTKTVPYSWENKFMDIDINVLAGPGFAALFAIDLKYGISQSNQFVSSGTRFETMVFKLPGYLQNCNSAVKVSHGGISNVEVLMVNGTAVITDSIFTTALYILYNSADGNTGDLLTSRYNNIIAGEESYNFDPINNDGDWKVLTREINLIDGVIEPTGIPPEAEVLKNIEIYPNPADGVVNIKIENPPAEINLQLLNGQGKLIQSRFFTKVSPGTFEKKINLPVSGICFVKISGDGINFTEKVVNQ